MTWMRHAVPAAFSSRAFRIAGPTSPTLVQVMPTAPYTIPTCISALAQPDCLGRKEQKLQQEKDEPGLEQEEEQDGARVLTKPSAILA